MSSKIVHMSKHIPSHFSEVMRDQFQERAIKNPSYSLRAFARDLELTSGSLSKILARKKGMSPTKASTIAKKMGLSGDEMKFFQKLVEANCARKLIDREKAKAKLLQYDTRYTKVEDDHFRVIAEWYHFAIFDLVRIEGFKFDYDWIAKRLAITATEAKDAVERLIKFDILHVVNDKLCQTRDFLVLPSGAPMEAAIKLHEQVLEKGLKAIRSQSVSERDFSSGFLRARTSDLPKIAARIKEFRRDLAKEVEAGEDHDSIYTLAVQFFRADAGQ